MIDKFKERKAPIKKKNKNQKPHKSCARHILDGYYFFFHEVDSVTYFNRNCSMVV